MLKLDYKQLFTDLDFEGQYPVETFSKTISKLIGNTRDPISLDFSGIDQLSDEVFFILKNELKDAQKDNVECVNLSGCINVTDRGIEILAQTFINIKELLLIGCTEITQLSLCFLMKYCHKLEKLSAQFTKISYIPKEIVDRWGIENIKCNHLFVEEAETDKPKLPINLVIITMDPDITCDIGHFLVTGKVKNRDINIPILFQQNAWEINDTDINIIQLFCPTSYMSPFISDRSLFIIVVDMASEISNAFNIIKGLDFIRGVVYSATVQILALTTSDDKKKLDDLSFVLRSIFSEQSVNMKEHLDREHYSRSCDKFFIDQWRYVQSLSTVDSDHLSLNVIGLNTSVERCNMCFCDTICEPNNTGKIAEIIDDFSHKFVNVKDSLERTNKVDITEIKSFAVLPAYLEKIFKAILIVLKKANSTEPELQQVKKFLNDPLFLSPLLDYNTFSYEENPEEVINVLVSIFQTKEELEKTSRGMKLSTSLGLWLLLKWNFCERLAPLKKKSKDFELLAEELKDAKTSHQVLCTNLSQNLIQLTNFMYEHSPTHFSTLMKDVNNAISKERTFITTVKDIHKELPQLSKSELCLVLEQLQWSGLLIYCKRVGMILRDMIWFVNVLNTILTKWNAPLNGDSVWFISSTAVISTQNELETILQPFCDSEMFKRVMIILRDFGLILSVVRSWNEDPQNFDPMVEFGNATRILVVSWHQLTIKPDSNRNLIINKSLEKPLPEIKILHQIFPDYASSEFLKDDISFKFSFKFRTGMPSNLFCQVVGKLVAQFRTSLLWNQGIIVREGAVDVMIAHNIHASRGSSSFDIESRILGPVNGRRPVAVREHMWSVLSDILTIMESSIYNYPYLHHKLRHYCRGQCYAELGQENTFSQAEISRSLNANYFCNKCKEYQMSRSEWLYILGRQLILPNHEINKYTKSSCKSCWKHKMIISKLWAYQLKIFPVFCNKFFDGGHVGFCQGNLVFSGTTHARFCSRLTCSSNYLRSIQLNVVDPSNIYLKLVSHPTSSQYDDLFRWRLDDATITTKLTKTHDNEAHLETNLQRPIVSGDTIQFFFHSDSDDEDLVMVIAINNLLAAKFSLSGIASVRFSIEMEPEESKNIKLIISNLDAAIYTALYFRPGMIILIKGETRWEPAVILEISKGKLNCQPLSSVDKKALVIQPVNNVVLFPSSVNILPPASYPSDVNSTLNSKNQKALADSWYSILEEYSDYSPAMFGFFPKIFDKKAYNPLPMFGQESRHCTSSIFSSNNILRLMFLNTKPIASRTSTSYLPLPFPLTPERLLIPQRLTINHFSNHSLNRLCPGTQWKGYLRDMHPMNEQPYHMTEGESKYFFGGDFAIDNFIIMKNFSHSFSAIYQNIDKCLPLIDPGINRNMLRDAIVTVSKTYRDIYLFDIVSKIRNYDSLVITMDKSSTEILKSVMKSKAKAKKDLSLKPHVAPKAQKGSSVTSSTDEEIDNIRHLLTKPQMSCESHKLSLDVMKVSDLGQYNQCIANIMIKGKEMENVHKTALTTCTRLRRLEIDFGVMSNTIWIKELPKLTSLTLSNCNLSAIGDEFENLKNTLKQLCLNGNPIKIIPDFICHFVSLDSLELNNTLISELPHNFGKLFFLKYLSIDHTKLHSLPQSFSLLKNLRTLRLGGVPPANLFNKNSGNVVSKKVWTGFCKKTHINGCIFDEQESLDLFDNFVGENNSLENTRCSEFENYLFKYFPRFTEFPIEIFDCTNLLSLIMPNQAFTNIPDAIQQLVHLKKVSFDGCLYLQTLSGHLGSLPLEVLSCQNCENLKTPPAEIRRQGMRNTIAYLLRLVSGSEACYRTKLMLVGLGGAGKTSLMRALMSKDFCAPHLAQECITDGIDIHTWSVKQGSDVTLQFSVWDFAGQTLYYNTHQFFLTGRSIYLLLWNVRQGFEHAGLDFWLNSITCHAPSAPIFIVGTHSDKVDRSEIPITIFKNRYPSVVNFHFISSLNGQGVEALHDSIIAETRRQPYIGEIVPNAWLRLEKDLISQRSTSDYLTFDNVKKLANNNAIYDGEVYQAIRFLHDLGSIQFFETALLKSYIIINSQWLVDVMACVVSVKHSVIENGKLEHSKIKDVWPDYPATIHMWLLRLTEIFDLTFSVAGQDFNYVPCLLDTNQPDFDWPQYILVGEIKESNMFYKFDYLPPGLFNRAQVRLSQYSDTFVIWQNGSLLNKNNDKALMTKLNDNMVKVCARGYWPDNILFIIHEVFETLISEAFSGVEYQYKISCRKCIIEREPMPHLFSNKILQRAIQSKTVFIQCHKNFHIMTMTDIQESMPPEGLEDYDLQFKRSIRMLSSTNEEFENMIMVLVSAEDYQNSESLLNTPKRIVNDLGKRKYHVWCEPLEEGSPQERFIDIMTRSEVIIAMMSGSFSDSRLCMTLFKLAKTTLRKSMSFVLLDKDYIRGDLGLEVVGQKYINFERANVYDQKIIELVHDLETLSSGNSLKHSAEIKPRVFFSYCWDNSKRAFEAGNSKRLMKNAIGWGDPRDIKEFLEQKGISCWLDIEMVGPNSVYTEITAGLRDSEMVVACLSSEYAASEACRKEFMFGSQNLGLPIIIAVVGGDSDWIKTEIGLLSVDYPKISFQEQNEAAFEDLFKQVSQMLETTSKKDAAKNYKNVSALASQEDFELIQRKIFRLLCSGFGNEESRMYPRLFFIDIFDVSEKNDGDKDLRPYLESLPKDNLLTSGIPEFSLCYRMLCESETGWHTVDEGIPIDLNQVDQERLLFLAAPYLQRITALLKYSNSKNIKIFSLESNHVVSEYVFDILEKNAKSFSYIKPIHSAMRTHIINKDIKMKYGRLRSCCLNSGKIVWLCEEHSNKSQISIISTEESNSLIKTSKRMGTDRNNDYDDGTVGEELVIKDDVLLNELESINKEQFTDADSSVDSKRVPNESNRMAETIKQPLIAGKLGSAEKNEVVPQLNYTINDAPDHILVPPLQIMQQKNCFQSKTCVVM